MWRRRCCQLACILRSTPLCSCPYFRRAANLPLSRVRQLLLRRSYALALHIVRNHPSSVSEQTPWQRDYSLFIMARWSSLFLLCVIGLAKASTIDIDGFEEEDGEERTVFTSGGTYYIALNTTYLLYYSLLAGRFSCPSINNWGSTDFTHQAHYFSLVSLSVVFSLVLQSRLQGTASSTDTNKSKAKEMGGSQGTRDMLRVSSGFQHEPYSGKLWDFTGSEKNKWSNCVALWWTAKFTIAIMSVVNEQSVQRYVRRNSNWLDTLNNG